MQIFILVQISSYHFNHYNVRPNVQAIDMKLKFVPSSFTNPDLLLLKLIHACFLYELAAENEMLVTVHRLDLESAKTNQAIQSPLLGNQTCIWHQFLLWICPKMKQSFPNILKAYHVQKYCRLQHNIWIFSFQTKN